jgi:hypothetical protein
MGTILNALKAARGEVSELILKCLEEAPVFDAEPDVRRAGPAAVVECICAKPQLTRAEPSPDADAAPQEFSGNAGEWQPTSESPPRRYL